MMRLMSVSVVVLLVGLLFAAATGCSRKKEEKGLFERMGEKTDEAVEKAGEATGSAVDKTREATGEGLKKAGEAVTPDD